MEAAARGGKLFEARDIPPSTAIELAPGEKLMLMELRSPDGEGVVLVSASKPVYAMLRMGGEELKGSKAWLMASSLSEVEVAGYALPESTLSTVFVRELMPPVLVSKLDTLSFYSDLLSMETGLMAASAEMKLYLFERRGKSTPPILAYGSGKLRDLWKGSVKIALYEVSDPECFITSEELPPPAKAELLSLARAVPYFPTQRDRDRVLSGVNGLTRRILEQVDGKRTCFDIKVETNLPLDAVTEIIDSFRRMGNVRLKS